MGTIVSTIKVGQKPTKEERKQMRAEIKEAKKAVPVYDPECPPSSPEALAEFAAMARERKHSQINALWKSKIALNVPVMRSTGVHHFLYSLNNK